MNFKNFVIKDTASILQAITKININGKRAIFVVNQSDQVVGVATDGDIRRALIQSAELSDLITVAMNKDFKAFYSGELNAAKELLREYKLIPILNKENKLLEDILFRDSLTIDAQSSTVNLPPVLIMAGGFGKRLRPLTDNLPKPMLKIGDMPLLEISLKYLKTQGFNSIYISTYYKGEIIKSYFGDGSSIGLKIKYIDEAEPSGTAGSIANLRDELKHNELIVMNGDILTKLNFLEFIQHHSAGSFDMTIASKYYEHTIPYGVIDATDGNVNSLIEKPTIYKQVAAGIYILNSKIIYDFINAGEYLDMPMLINTLLQESISVSSFPIHEYWLDIGSKEDFSKAQDDLKVFFND